MMLRTLLTSVLCLLPLAAQTPTAIKIGTWNLEFLGADPKYRRDTPPRTDEDVAAIGRKVVELGVSVLGVQEISGEAVLQQVARAAGPTWRAVLGTTGKWSDGKTQQGVGFLFDSQQVELLHAEELLDFPSERDGVSVFHRKPVTACLKHRATGCDFRIVVVHLKAGRKDRDKKKRRAEAVTLREYVDMLRSRPGEDADVMILGDFNCSYGDTPEHVLERDGAMRYLDQTSPTIMHFDTPIDQVCVASGFTEVVPDSMVSHHVVGEQPKQRFRKTYSDHFPITVTLLANGDDDPDATFRRGQQNQVLPLSKRPKARAPRALAAPPAAAGPSLPWAPTVGSNVTVRVAGREYTGQLAAPLPADGGWVVVRTTDWTYSVPMRQVEWVRFAIK